jgi:hypothetical protein
LEFKRGVRNSAGTVLAMILIALGYVRRAKNHAFQKDVILAIAFHNPTSKLLEKSLTGYRKTGLFLFRQAG